MTIILEPLKTNRYLYLSIYILSNFYFVFAYSFIGTLGGDFTDRYPASLLSLLVAFILILFYWFLFIFAFVFFEKIKVNSIKHVNSSLVDYLMFILALLHLNGLISGFISPSADVEPSVFYLLFNYLFSVDMLLLIYLFYNVGKIRRIYYVNLFLTIFIYLYSGRTGIFIYMLPLYNLYYYSKRGQINFVVNCILIGFAFFIFPFFRSLKHYSLLTVISDRYGELSFFDGFVEFWSENDFFITYFKYFNETLERFEHVSNVSFVMDNVVSINLYLSNFDFSYIYPATKRIIENILSLPNVPYQLNKLIGGFVSQGETFQWNVPVGIPGLFFIDGSLLASYIFFSILLILFSVLISKLINNNGFLLELTFLSMLLFVLHGWLNDFISYVFSLIVFFIIICTVKYLNIFLKPDK